VEIEQSSETLHAHVVLDGDIQIQPGDEVTVHNAPTHVAFGERLVVRRMATVVRGSALDRLRAKLEGYLELTELYEVSFSDGRAA
jgi:archaeosine-15-forming tRNA-guanine transglycosylase